MSAPVRLLWYHYRWWSEARYEARHPHPAPTPPDTVSTPVPDSVSPGPPLPVSTRPPRWLSTRVSTHRPRRWWRTGTCPTTKATAADASRHQTSSAPSP